MSDWRLMTLLGGLLGVLLAVGIVVTGPVYGAEGNNVPMLDSLDPDAGAMLVLHKLEQSDGEGVPATGLPDAASVAGMEPIPGVTFEVRKVPGVDLTSVAGWDRAQALQVDEATELVAGVPVAGSGVTGTTGVVELGGLDIGLYYVSETNTLAGVVESPPFLVTLPMPHPTSDSWLYTVHVYPKNARVGVALDVRDENAVTCGDTVTWTAHADIPRNTNISRYMVRNVLAAGVEPVGSASKMNVTIDVPGAEVLVFGTDYIVAEFGMGGAGFVASRTPDAVLVGDRVIDVADGERGFDVAFTPTGLAKLVTHPGAQVRVDYPSRITGPGEHVNQVRLYVNESTPVEDSAATKFGPLDVWVHERGNESTPIPGVSFRLYLTVDDALAGRNWVTEGDVSEWVSGPDGMFSIGCVRFSHHANGLDRDPNDPLYRPYVVAPGSYPAGWTGNRHPQVGTVTNAGEALRFVFEVWRSGVSDPSELPSPVPSGNLGEHEGLGTPAEKPGWPELPRTGARVGGAFLLTVTLVGVGVVLVRRRGSEEEAL